MNTIKDGYVQSKIARYITVRMSEFCEYREIRGIVEQRYNEYPLIFRKLLTYKFYKRNVYGGEDE